MKPLEGIRVVDLSRLLPGPFATQVLVDLGAEVIKVEEPNGGDYLRHMPPQLDDGLCVLFHAINRGKKSVCLDLKNATDVARFEKLCATADVVVESFRPGVLDKLGVGPRALLERHPRLVVCSISGYGQNGAYRLRAGHDVNYLARAGILGMMRDPTLLPVQVADLAGGAQPAVTAILAALLGRVKTGKGALVDVSMTHQAAGLLASSYARVAAGEREIGDGHDVLVGRVPCYGVYPCKDGFMSVGSLEPKFWHGLCAAIGRPDLDDRGMDFDQNAEDVRRMLSDVFRTKTRAEWSAVFEKHDVCVEPVRTPEEAIASGDFAAVDVVVNGSTVTLPIPAIAIDGVTPSREKAPALGEHTDAILGAL